jgi:integrase
MTGGADDVDDADDAGFGSLLRLVECHVEDLMGNPRHSRHPRHGAALRPLQDREVRRLLDWLRRAAAGSRGRPQWLGLRDAAVVVLLLDAGLRPSEVRALRVGDLHLDDARPWVAIRRGKGARSRQVPVSSAVGLWVRRYLAASAERGLSADNGSLVFPGGVPRC